MMKWKKKSKILKLLWNRLFKYGWYKQKNVWKNGTKIIADNDGILWSNEKQMEQGLEHKNLWEITTKYHLSHKKQIWTSWWTKKTVELNFYGRKNSNQSNYGF